MSKSKAKPQATDDSNEVIDASCRGPLLVMFVKGAGWLVLGLLLLLIASIKLHGPGFLSGSAWLGLGRVKPAAMVAITYGFAIQAAFGVGLWLLCRLGRTVLLNTSFIHVSTMVWNIGVFLGFIGILAGHGTGHAFVEMPRIAWPFLFVATGIMSLWGLLTFHARRERGLYVSQWYVVAALFWLPWIMTGAVYLLVFDPVRGVMQSVVSAWYAHNLMHLWLGGIGLATLFYFIPKLTGKPLWSRELAIYGFLTMALFACWGGTARLAGGPLPSWMISVGVASTVMMLLPLCCVLVNLHYTVEGNTKAVLEQARENLPLRFLLFGLLVYADVLLLQALTSFRVVGQLTQFTFIPMALDHLMILGFFGMTVMGAVYFIVPRITGIAWPSEKLARLHFLGSAGGITLYGLALIIGGLVHGARMNNAEVEFMSALKSTIPFVGLSTVGLLVLLAAQVAFALNIHKLARQYYFDVIKSWCKDCCDIDLGRKKAGAKS